MVYRLERSEDPVRTKEGVQRGGGDHGTDNSGTGAPFLLCSVEMSLCCAEYSVQYSVLHSRLRVDNDPNALKQITRWPRMKKRQ